MLPTLREAEEVIEDIVPVLEEFPWFHGVGVEQDPYGFFVCVRVSPDVSLEDARSKSLIPKEKRGVRIDFRHQEMASALSLAM